MVTPWLALFVATSTAAPAGKLELERAQALFLQRRYGEALVSYEAAYARSGRRPSTMFALAQCHRALENFEDALRFYEEYRATGLDLEEAARVDNTLEVVMEQLTQQRAARAATPARARAPPEPPPALAPPPLAPPAEASGHLGYQLGVAGTGVAAVAIGVALGELALADAREGRVDGTLTQGRVADGLIISGAVALAAAVVWWLID